MADFLGSILGSMAAPPRATDKEIAERKKARELAKKLEERNKKETQEFRQETEKRVDAFLKLPIGDENRSMVFEAMPKGTILVQLQVFEKSLIPSSCLQCEDPLCMMWQKLPG